MLLRIEALNVRYYFSNNVHPDLRIGFYRLENEGSEKKMTITLFKTDLEKEIEKTTRRMVQKRRKLLKIG